MTLIAVYIALVIAGDYWRTVEHWSPAASRPVFLALFFLVFSSGWKAPIRLT
jgi:hypothetical protein